MDRELSFKATTGETIRVKWGAAEDPTDQDLTDIEQAWYSSHPRPKAQTQNAAPRPLQGSLGAPVPVDPFRDGMKVQKPAQAAQPPKAIPAGFGVIGGQDLIPEARDKKPAPRQENRDVAARRATADSINPKKIAAKVAGDAADTAKREQEARGFWRDVAMARDAKAGAVKQTDPGYVGSEAQDMAARGEFGVAHWKRVAGENQDRTLNPVASELARRVGGNLSAQKDIYKGMKDASAKLGILDPLAGLSISPENIVMSAALGAGGKLLHGAFGNPAIFGKLTGMVGKGADELALSGNLAQFADEALKSNADRQLEGHVATALKQALGEDVKPAPRATVVPEGQPLYRGGVRDSQGGYSHWTPNKEYALNYSPDGTVHEAKAPSGLYDWIGDEKKHEEFRSFLRAELDKANPQTLSELNDAKTARELLDGPLDPKATGRASVLVGFAKHGGFAKTPIASAMKAFMERKGIGAMVDVESDGSYSVLMRNSAEPRATGQAVPDKGLEPTNVPKAPEPSPKPTPAATGNVEPTAGTPGAKEPWQMTRDEAKALPEGQIAGTKTKGKDIELWATDGVLGEARGQLDKGANGHNRLTIGWISSPFVDNPKKLPKRVVASRENGFKGYGTRLLRSIIDSHLGVGDEISVHAPSAQSLPLFEKAVRDGILDLAGIESGPYHVYTVKKTPHRLAIEQALKDGKPVPPEVLADYPDLAAKYKPTGPTLSDAVANPTGKAQGVTPENFARNPLQTKAPKVGPMSSHARDIISEGGTVRQAGKEVEISFTPKIGASDIVDRLPDEVLNPNSFMGAAELSSRQTYRNIGGKNASAAISNAVNQGQIMSRIDNMRFTRENGVVNVIKRKGEPFRVVFENEDAARRFTDEFRTSGPTVADAVGTSRTAGGETRRVTPESFARKPLDTKAEPKPAEPKQGPSQATGLANQVQDREALQGILDQVEPTKGKSAEDWQKIGKAKVESGEINPHELAQQIADGDVELTGERVGALLEGKRRLELDVNNAKPGAEYEAAKQRLQDYVEQVQQGKGRWSDVGRALQAGTTVDEGNFAQVIEHARRSGAELNPKQEAEIRRLAEQVKSKDEQLAAAQKIIEDQQASMTAQNVARAARRLKTGDVQKARDAARARFVKASAANTFVNDEQMAAWWDLAKTYVQKGDTPDSLIERIRKDLGDQLPDYITDADMKAAMALGGKPQQAAKRARTEIEKEIAKLRREAKVQTGVRDSELSPQIQKRIADLQDQLDTGQYRLPKARAAMYGPEVERLQAQRDVLAAQVRARIKDAATPVWGLKGKVAKEITGGIRGLQLGSDLGVLRRQGLFAWSHPILAAKNVGKAARAMLSDENLAVMERKIMERTNSEGQLLAPIRKKAGLSLTIGPLNQDEEMIVGRLLKRIPGIGTLAGKPLERFQVAWLNGVRADLFDASVAKGFTPEERALRAQFINSVTGRSNLKSVPDAMSVLMTSPRYEASRWETIFAPVKNLAALGKDALTGKGVNRAAVANLKDMAVTAGTVLATYKAAELAGYKVNWDPESSDFLKMRKGDEVWDVSAGLAPRLRDIARLYIAATHPDYKHNMADVIRGMAVRTISPAVRMPVQWGSHQTQSAAGETAVKDPFTGFPADKYEQGWRLLTPLIVRSIEQAWDQPGDTPTKLKTAASAGAREFVGDSVNRYPAKK